MIMFKYVLTFAGRALVFRKGYRKAGFILWFVILGIVSSVHDYLTADERNAYAASMDYQTMCSNGEFDKAHLVKAKYYKEYSTELGAWRSGAWRDREAREAQEKYHATAAYIFGQEIVAIYRGTAANKAQQIIDLLVEIPVEGRPLTEGEYGSGMFYNNDASISSPTSIDHVVYQSWVAFYNGCCDKVLDLALANNDIDLANKVHNLYKTEVSTHYTADTTKGGDYNIATVVYNNSRKEAAAQRLADYNENKITSNNSTYGNNDKETGSEENSN